jgi:hypothetical protein
MRALQISGVLLIVIGLGMIVRPPSYSREESVFKLGDIEATMRQEHRVPGWVGGMALGAGVVLFVVGIKEALNRSHLSRIARRQAVLETW